MYSYFVYVALTRSTPVGAGCGAPVGAWARGVMVKRIVRQATAIGNANLSRTNEGMWNDLQGSGVLQGFHGVLPGSTRFDVQRLDNRSKRNCKGFPVARVSSSESGAENVSSVSIG